MLPGHMDRNLLQPMYARIFEKIKAASPDQIMMFEPPLFPDFLGFSVLGHQVDYFPAVGFTKPPGAEVNSPNHALNFHTYCCNMNGDVCAKYGEPEAKYQESGECLKWHTSGFSARSADAKRLGIPIILSEFGSCLDTKQCFKEIMDVTDTADQYLSGWAYWQFKTFKDLTSSAGN